MGESTARSRHPNSIGQAFLWALLSSLALLLIASPAVSLGQVVITNISPITIAPLDLGTNVDTVGSTTEITGGTRPGNGTNLFHSFDVFTLGTGDTAHFLNDMQLPTTNIFGRVIGGEVSTIDGTLRTNNPLNAADPMNFGAANLWLVNPSGLFLGANARIEVGGSVSMSTADYLRFEGTPTLFDMLSSPASLGPLSIAPVAAFGFLGPELPAPIAVQGSILAVPIGQSLSLVGGNGTFPNLDNPSVDVSAGVTMTGGTLSAPGGQINVVSVASAGEVIRSLAGPNPAFDVSSFVRLGDITLASNTALVTSGDGGGTVVIRGGHLTIDRSTVRSDTRGSNDGARIGVDINIAGDLQVLNGSQIGTFTRGSGNGGPIDVRANSLLISGVDLSDEAPSSLLSSAIGTAASGIAGNIRVQADSVVVEKGGLIRADLVGGSPGNAGNIDITAETVDISNRGLILATAVEGTGPAGRVNITANDVRIIGDGTVDPFSAWLGSNRGFDFPTDLPPPPEWFDATGIRTSTNAGRGGELMLTADTLAITDNGAITSRTIGSGDAGTIDLHIANNVTLMKGGIVSASTSGTGVGGNLSVATDTLMLSDGGILSASTFGVVPEATGGTIRVDATTVSLTGGSQIASDSFGPGVGGAIHITASDLVTLTGTSADGLTPTLVVTDAQATGNLADIVVQTKNLTASGGAHVRTESLGSRDAGSIHVKATETVSLAGESADGVFGSGLFANTVGSGPDAGDGGSITVEAKNLTIEGSAQIGSGTFGFGEGGTINVTVAEALTIAGTSADGVFASGLFANSEGSMPGSGKGGNIFVATKYLSAEGGGQISTISLGSGTGGTIRVTATELLTLNGRSPDGSWPSGLVANAESGASDAGDAGNIVVETKELIIEGGAEINSTSFGPGAGGNVNVQTARMTMDNGASVSTASSGTGDAGTITINAGSEFLSTNSSVKTEATQASGGNITLVASDMIRLRNSQISASVFGEAETSGGNITIDPQFVILQNSQIIAQADAGSGGTINVTAGVFIADATSFVDASATSGNSGTVSIQSPVQNVGGQLTPLPQEFNSAAALLFSQRCAADSTGQFSSFIQTGREGVPQIPGALSPSPLSFLETLTSGSLGSPSPNWAAARLGLDSVWYDDSPRFPSACRS